MYSSIHSSNGIKMISQKSIHVPYPCQFQILNVTKKILSTLIETQLLSALIETKSFQNSFHVCYYNRIYHKKIKYFVTKIVQFFLTISTNILWNMISCLVFFFRFLMHLTISINALLFLTMFYVYVVLFSTKKIQFHVKF